MNSAPNHPIDQHEDQSDEEEVQDDELWDGQDDAEGHRGPLCGDVPAYHMSTRLVGTSIAGIVMVAPSVRGRPQPVHAER